MTKEMYVKDINQLNYLATGLFGKNELIAFYMANNSDIAVTKERSGEKSLIAGIAMGVLTAMILVLTGVGMIASVFAGVGISAVMFFVSYLDLFNWKVEVKNGTKFIEENKDYQIVDSAVLNFLMNVKNSSFEKEKNIAKSKLFKKVAEAFRNREKFVLTAEENIIFPSFLIASFCANALEIDRERRNERPKARGNELLKARGNELLKTVNPMKIVNMVEAAPFVKIINDVNAEYRNHEMDIVSILKYPVISDMRFPATKNFIILLSLVESLKPQKSMIEADHMFVVKVHELNFAWDLLKSEARRIRLSNYAPNERQKVERAQRFITIALDDSASPHERQVAYKRVVKELEGVIVIPAKALISLEAKAGLLSIESQN